MRTLKKASASRKKFARPQRKAAIRAEAGNLLTRLESSSGSHKALQALDRLTERETSDAAGKRVFVNALAEAFSEVVLADPKATGGLRYGKDYPHDDNSPVLKHPVASLLKSKTRGGTGDKFRAAMLEAFPVIAGSGELDGYQYANLLRLAALSPDAEKAIHPRQVQKLFNHYRRVESESGYEFAQTYRDLRNSSLKAHVPPEHFAWVVPSLLNCTNVEGLEAIIDGTAKDSPQRKELERVLRTTAQKMSHVKLESEGHEDSEIDSNFESGYLAIVWAARKDADLINKIFPVAQLRRVHRNLFMDEMGPYELGEARFASCLAHHKGFREIFNNKRRLASIAEEISIPPLFENEDQPSGSKIYAALIAAAKKHFGTLKGIATRSQITDVVKELTAKRANSSLTLLAREVGDSPELKAGFKGQRSKLPETAVAFLSGPSTPVAQRAKRMADAAASMA